MRQYQVFLDDGLVQLQLYRRPAGAEVSFKLGIEKECNSIINMNIYEWMIRDCDLPGGSADVIFNRHLTPELAYVMLRTHNDVWWVFFFSLLNSRLGGC